MLESCEVVSQAEIARREGVSRARVTQIMGLLRLAPEIHEAILSMPATTHRSIPAEPALRSVARLADRNEQLREFSALATVATVPH